MGASMSDAAFFALIGLVAAAMIALALVWPQGLGQRSPAPFGHPVLSENLEAPAGPTLPPPPSPTAAGALRDTR